MRLQAAITGDLRKVVANQWRRGGAAIRAGLREAGKGLQADLRADASSAGLGRLSKVWRMRTYRGRQGPWESSVLVYPKGGERTRGALAALEHGATIRAKQKRFLAIPTNFNRRGGRRGGKVLFQPGELQGAFTKKSSNGNLLLFAPVRQAGKRLASGNVRKLAFVETQLLGSGRVKRTEKILQARAVPMFVLVPQVRIRKRLNIRGTAEKWRGQVGLLIVKHWRRQNAR